MYKYLCDKIGVDKDLPERAHVLSARMHVLDGTLYDILEKPFHQERKDDGEYIPIRERRPSARYNVSRIVVNDTVGMLFGDAHFPRVAIEGNPESEKLLARFIKETKLEPIMNTAAYQGSVGSIAIRFRVFNGKCFFDPLPTRYLTPTYEDKDPETLKGVVEEYKIKGEDLKAVGYTVPDDDLAIKFWFKREWTKQAEIWYMPLKIPLEDGKTKNYVRDTDRSVEHGLDFVPIVWIENLPAGCEPDGMPTFTNEVVDIGIEIDYLLSQGGRGLKYSSQPNLVIKSDDPTQKIIAGDTIVVPTSGDAKLMEIDGGAAQAVVDYVKFLRELALEQGGGNRTNADTLAGTKSGRAMEMMNAGLINVAAKLRTSYGENGLLQALRMFLKTRAAKDLKFRDGSLIPKLAVDVVMTLVWPSWQPPTNSDVNELVGALSVGKTAGIVSTEVAVKNLSSILDVEDINAEVAAIKAETAEDAALQMKIKSTPAKPNKADE